MKRILGMALCGLLLAGCAGGGRFVSAGPVDYGKLMAALRCEVKNVYEIDRNGVGKLEGWKTVIDVRIKGKLDREADIGAGVRGFGIGRERLLTADIGADRSFLDTGTVLLSDETFPHAPNCQADEIEGYDLSNLDLAGWYRKVEKRIGDQTTAKKVASIKYERIVNFKFIGGNLEVAFFSPGWVTPGFEFSSSEEAIITITFQKDPGPQSVPVFALDDETLRRLAEVIRSGGTSVPPRSRAARPGATALDAVERDRLRELERLDDRLQFLNRNLLGD